MKIKSKLMLALACSPIKLAAYLSMTQSPILWLVHIILSGKIWEQINLSGHYLLYSSIASQNKTNISLNTKFHSLRYCQDIYLIATRLINLTLQSPDFKILNLTLTYLTHRKLIMIPPLQLWNRKTRLWLLDTQVINAGTYTNWTVQ